MMMYIPDFENAIVDYLTNCGQSPEGWDVQQASMDLRDMCPEAVSIDDVPMGIFIEVLEENEL